tara:strand:- start:1900 stop:2271 length:372 start_codon:yes stop_codon:yes gene_type:complete
MSIIFKKYEFKDKEQYQTALSKLPTKKDVDGEKYPDYNHSIVELGNIVIKEGEYDDDFQQIKAPVLSDKYHVDVLWKKSEITQIDKDGVKSIKYPTGWVSKEIDFDNGEGVHTFLGVSYQANK